MPKPKVKPKHHFWTLKRKVFTIGALSAIIVFSFVAAANRFQKDEAELKQLRQNKDVLKVQQFAMFKEPRLWPKLAEEIALAEVKASVAYCVPLELLVGVQCKEGNMYPFALSKTGAAGGHQVDFEANKEEFPVKYEWQKYQPEYNASCSAWMLSRLIRKHGVKKALMLYNLGEGNYKKGMRADKYYQDVLALSGEFRYFEVR